MPNLKNTLRFQKQKTPARFRLQESEFVFAESGELEPILYKAEYQSFISMYFQRYRKGVGFYETIPTLRIN